MKERMEEVFIHPTAEVSEDAVVGSGTRIWNQAQVRENAVIGEGCNIGKNVYIDFGVTIGSRTKIQNNVSVFHGVEIGEDVFIGPSVTFTNDRFPRAFHDDYEVGHTVVKRGASLCASATIRCDVTIGQYATVAAGAVVTKDVPDHALVAGVPAEQNGWVCKCGRRLDDSLKCNSCGLEYAKGECGLAEIKAE